VRVVGLPVAAAVALVAAAALGPTGDVRAQPATDEPAKDGVDVADASAQTEQPSDEAGGEGQADAEASEQASAAGSSDGDVPYTVECAPDPEQGGRDVCRVDRDTYVGWRTFHSVCHTCHAQDAVGSSFAPALLPRIRQIDKERFVMVVDQGFTGQVGVMPAWGTNPNVNRFYDELWAYLRARADGELPPGRPARLPED